jgi:hypothetical protein
VKVGDLVKLPEDKYFWWSGKVGIIVAIETPADAVPRNLRIMVGPHRTKFGERFVELINEGR